MNPPGPTYEPLGMWGYVAAYRVGSAPISALCANSLFPSHMNGCSSLRGPANCRFVSAYPGCAAALVSFVPARAARRASSKQNIRFASLELEYAIQLL